MGCVMNIEKFTQHYNLVENGNDEKLKKHVIVLFQENVSAKMKLKYFLEAICEIFF